MALTPEDVVNKRFQSTKFREGYDQDEVDDFLDEIVVELRRLTQENDELRQRSVAADARIAELQRGGGSQVAMEAPASAPVPAPTPAPAPAPAPLASAPAADESENTNNLLQLARRLHEEHVRDGMKKRDEIIAEGQAEASRIVNEAQSFSGRSASGPRAGARGSRAACRGATGLRARVPRPAALVHPVPAAGARRFEPAAGRCIAVDRSAGLCSPARIARDGLVGRGRLRPGVRRLRASALLRAVPRLGAVPARAAVAASRAVPGLRLLSSRSRSTSISTRRGARR